MPFSYPLSLAAFQDKFNITMAELHLNNPRQLDRTAGGSQLSASLGDSVWRGAFETPPTNVRAEAASLDALLSVLDRAGSSFLVYDPSKPHPADDPGGSITGGASVTIGSLSGTDARVMSLAGLPAGFSLRAGDLIGWTYGSSPVRYALHRLVEDVSGTDTFEVTPFIQPGATVGAAVTLIKPVMKAVMLPNPSYGSHRAVISSGKQFSFVQTLR